MLIGYKTLCPDDFREIIFIDTTLLIGGTQARNMTLRYRLVYWLDAAYAAHTACERRLFVVVKYAAAFTRLRDTGAGIYLIQLSITHLCVLSGSSLS